MVTAVERGRDVRQRLLRAATELIAAAVLTAVVDGLLLHRALVPGPTSGEVAAVLRRLLERDAEAGR